MADELQKRIGRDTEKGREWPALDLLGRAYYHPPAGTVGLGGGHFAVIPAGVKPAQYKEALEQVRDYLASQPSERTVPPDPPPKGGPKAAKRGEGDEK
jgi:hypothetical protein